MRWSGYRAALAAAVIVGYAGMVAVPVASAATTLPAHVYAPYYEGWVSGSMASTAQASGARVFTLAFLQTTGKGSCTLAWGGSKSQTIGSSKWMADIADLRALGDDVIPSFGGWSADQGGTEIGDSCKDPKLIAAAYEGVVERYDVTRLDMDIEGNSLTNTAGIDRRNKAIKMLQDWAPTANRTVQVQYTLPTTRAGLAPSGLAVLQNAVANGVAIDLVNPMAFDYYDRATTPMGQSAINALTGLHAQLAALLPTWSSGQIWAAEGVTLMIGLDDYKRKTEVTTLADASAVLSFARANGLSAISIWAIQRDNGGCTTVSGSCSGIVQGTWDFSHLLEGFTAG